MRFSKLNHISKIIDGEQNKCIGELLGKFTFNDIVCVF